MELTVFSDYDARLLQPTLRYWLQRLDFSCELRLLPAYQLFQQLLDPALVSGAPGVDIVLTEAVADEDLSETLSARHRVSGRACLACGPAIPSLPWVTWVQPDEPGPVALATALVRALLAQHRPPIKLIVVDADHTLWDGVVAEEEVTIGPERQQLQRFLLQQQRAGVLLAVCSKNEPADAHVVFDQHPDMVLRTADITAWRVGWRPKSEQVFSLAQELSLGHESILILDDNPLEVAEFRAHSLAALQVPAECGRFVRALWMLDRPSLTAEDGQRALYYQQDEKRRRQQQAAPDLASFVRGLELRVEFQPLAEADLERASQLTFRTNQFHLAPRPRSVAELRQQSGAVVRVSDRLGDYGLVGLLLWNYHPDHLAVETFLLSCRALGRGVEHEMLNHLAQHELPIRLHYQETARNQPAGQFWHEVEGEEISWQQAAQVRWKPAPVTPATIQGPVKLGFSSQSLLQIAEEAWTSEQVAEQVRRAGRRSRPELAHVYQPPQGPHEEAVARAWSEVLGVTPVGSQDGFFELGGDSLAMIAVLARLQNPPSLEQFLAQPTVAGLARSLAGEVPAPLAWVSELSDEQVAVVLERMENPALIQAIGIPTCARPEAVARAVRSFHEQLQLHGRSVRLVVSDSSGPAQAEATRQRLELLQIRLEYFGPTEWGELRAGLVRKGVPPQLLAFAMDGETGGGLGSRHRHGANQNALQLLLAGVPFYCPDDDTLAAPIRAGQLDAPVRIRPGIEAEEVWPGQPGPSEFVKTGVDLLGSHEKLLGRPVVELTGQARNPLDWVAMTFNGLAGDCGLGPPFGVWEAPLGSWWLSERSHARLSEEKLALSRRHLRMAEAPTLSDGRGSLSTFFALDNRKLMPPWFPTYRGADRLFPRMLTVLHPDAVFGHVPLALPHEPVNPRNFWPGEVFRSSAGVDIFRILIELVESCSGDLGAYFVEMGQMPKGISASSWLRRCKPATRPFKRCWKGERVRPGGAIRCGSMSIGSAWLRPRQTTGYPWIFWVKCPWSEPAPTPNN